MAIQLIGSSGVTANVDPAGNVLFEHGEAGYTTGGEYSASGFCTSIVAAALAANTSLITLRFAVASSRKAYLRKFQMFTSPATLGAAGGVAGVLGLQRFTTATPSGGTARTAAKKNSTHPSTSDMTDIRDSNAALTVTSVVFGDLLASSIMPLAVANSVPHVWNYEPDDQPIVLAAGDGLAMRTQVAMAATQTWVFAWTAQWYEK
jgi:hypothetical protein